MSNKSLRRRQYKTTGSSALTDGQISSLVEQLLSKHGDDYAPLNEVLTKLAQSVDTMGAGEVPLTFSTGSTRTVNTITINLSTGKAGSQSVIGGTAASETLTLSSTAHATKGKVLFGDSAFNEATNILGIGTASPTLHKIVVADTILAGSGSLAGGLLNMTQTWNTSGTPTAIFLNVTDTASNAASKLIDLQVGAATKFNVDKAGNVISAATVRTAGYTVVTLPATPTQGDRAFVTDATAPTYGAVLVGGGAVVVPVFYNGAAWVSA